MSLTYYFTQLSYTL